jgi:hypothetical protein
MPFVLPASAAFLYQETASAPSRVTPVPLV